ncbi:MAG: four helix bundle protein [Acidobacteriota bacterium]|nr:MAG: four helix bundle protein [Acidobacteriota bacterium]
MPTFTKFEEIQVWQKAREITNRVYLLSNSGDFSRDFSLRDQAKRASLSIMANIAEGHGRRTTVEFANFLNIARTSAIELQSHLYIALDLNYIRKNDFDDLYDELEQVSKMTLSLARYLRDSGKKE